jgi:hypothetical protein
MDWLAQHAQATHDRYRPELQTVTATTSAQGQQLTQLSQFAAFLRMRRCNPGAKHDTSLKKVLGTLNWKQCG